VLDTPAVKVAPGDLLTVDGVLVGEPEPTRVWRYHKPTGLVTTHRDPKGRATVFEHLPEHLPRVISVGRLDLNSEGLLLLTNDGELARALELPATGLVRRYRARARGHTTQARLEELKGGLTVEGVHYGPIEASLDKAKEGPQGANLWITLTLTEGKNREVRKVLEALGLTVNRLIRLAYGPFQLGTLGVGEVEEVGPRVIREQLAAHIASGSLPTGARAPAPRPSDIPQAPGSAGRPVRRGGGPVEAQGEVGARRPFKAAPKASTAAAKAPAKTEYKEGWARPKKRAPRPAAKPKRSAGGSAKLVPNPDPAAQPIGRRPTRPARTSARSSPPPDAPKPRR